MAREGPLCKCLSYVVFQEGIYLYPRKKVTKTTFGHIYLGMSKFIHN